MAIAVETIKTAPFSDQRPGTSGLRQPTRHFMQPHYLENFIQATFDTVFGMGDAKAPEKTLVVGGDGRFYNRHAIQVIIRMATANGFKRVMVGMGGLLSTPAMSAVIRKQGMSGGFILSASHNPGGIDADFGIKFNGANGAPAPIELTERIYQRTLEIDSYRTIAHTDLLLDRLDQFSLNSTEVVLFDPVVDYTTLMEEVFDFDWLRDLFRKGFRLTFDAMHAVTGPYAQHIFERCLGAAYGSVLRALPKENFGGIHPDPNQVHAKELIERMFTDGSAELGAASDGDGDRNMILGRHAFVSPCDSLAVIAEHATKAIPGYRHGLKGLARSMPTSTALDRVAKTLNIPLYETPTGWKYFASLMDAGKCSICGEESFGTGSDHVREKDGLWAVLCWLSIIAETKLPVTEILERHWQRFGRSYFQRHDYENLAVDRAEDFMDKLCRNLPQMVGKTVADSKIEVADQFSYTDPIDGTTVENQGVRLLFANNSRVIFRLSGTGTKGATLRIYYERFSRHQLEKEVSEMIAPVAEAVKKTIELEAKLDRQSPDLIT